jgi:asparagine synthase (glutamine-hydrolysing)
MCGICGIYNLTNDSIPDVNEKISIMIDKIKHRGPDGNGHYINKDNNIALGHTRLKIMDLSPEAGQPFKYKNLIMTYNGEVYNYKQILNQYEENKSDSDTEAVIKHYFHKKNEALEDFDGMWSFVIYDERECSLFCCRDRFGIKPFYYTIENHIFYFASEVKALLPFIKPEVNEEGLIDYLHFQLYLDNKTLFKNVYELEPGCILEVKRNKFHKVTQYRYWKLEYEFDRYHTEEYFIDRLNEQINRSVKYHLTSAVPVASYVSGGLDSGLVTSIASKHVDNLVAFTGKFEEHGDLFDESKHARSITKNLNNTELRELNITSKDFINNINKTIYHLDYPIAGPGSFSQFMMSKFVSENGFKVILGGQGGDEIFGGYVRYLIAYFEQCIKGAIDNTLNDGNFIVTYDSIISSLSSLYNYKELIKKFWSKGLFESMDRRYFNLINRFNGDGNKNSVINYDFIKSGYNVEDVFCRIFNSKGIKSNSYFDRMTFFDVRTLLPGLLQVEDRMSMGFGIESRVPLLNSKIIELTSIIPSNIKFKNGVPKYIFKELIKRFNYLPNDVINRKDKMGFSTPVNIWFNNELKGYFIDILRSSKNNYFNYNSIINSLKNDKKEDIKLFSRDLWGYLSLELWFKQFIETPQSKL